MANNGPDDSRVPHWLAWLAGAVTILAAAMLLLAVVLGVRAGQQQLAIQTRQQVGIHLQRAIDLRSEGNLQASLSEYQQVLVLDPSNAGAIQGIENLLQIASSGQSTVLQPGNPPQAVVAANVVANSPLNQPPPQPTAAAPQAATPVSTSAPTPKTTATPTTSPAKKLWDRAQSLYAAGDWQGAVDTMLELEAVDPGYGDQRAEELLFTSYVNLAAESDREGELEDALDYVDQALAIQPDSLPLRKARTMAATYLEMLSYVGEDWAVAIQLLEELYAEDVGYRDVENRLQNAYASYGDTLAEEDDWCDALDQYLAAIELDVTPGLFEKRNEARRLCPIDDAVARGAPTRPARTAPTVTPTPRVGAARATATPRSASVTPSLTPSVARPVSTATVAGIAGLPRDDDEAAATATPTEEPVAIAGSPPGGRILYAAKNPDDGRSRIFALGVGSDAAPSVFVEDGTQPALRSDAARIVYYNTRSDMAGLTSYDPGSGLTLRFTSFAEDSRPSWSPDGNQFVFASNREGDRRWRIYAGWAETDGAAINLGFGDSAAWSPTSDQIAFHGCDESGNGCGLWRVNSGGGDRGTLTSQPSDITPNWSPNGQTVVFTSNGRHGNYEVYALNAASGTVTRLTDHPANDGIPAVSPDGTWVAFLSDRGGRWQLWGVPITGGEAVVLGEIEGQVGNWLDQQIQWVN